MPQNRVSAMFKIEVSNALQTRFGPSKYTSFKTTQPKIENEDVTWSPQYNMPATRTNKRRALSLQTIELDGWFLILHIYCKHVSCNSCTTIIRVLYSFLYSSIDVLDLNQPFSWRAENWEPFKMKLIWGLQSWTLGKGHYYAYDTKHLKRCSIQPSNLR